MKIRDMPPPKRSFGSRLVEHLFAKIAFFTPGHVTGWEREWMPKLLRLTLIGVAGLFANLFLTRGFGPS